MLVHPLFRLTYVVESLQYILDIYRYFERRAVEWSLRLTVLTLLFSSGSSVHVVHGSDCETVFRIDTVIPTSVVGRPLRFDEKLNSGKIGLGTQQENVECVVCPSSVRWCSLYSSSSLYVVLRFEEQFFGLMQQF